MRKTSLERGSGSRLSSERREEEEAMGCSVARGCFLATFSALDALVSSSPSASAAIPRFSSNFSLGARHPAFGSSDWSGYAHFSRHMKRIASRRLGGMVDRGVSRTGWLGRRFGQRMQRYRVECCSTIAGSDALSSSKKSRIFVPKVSFCPSCGGAMEERVPKGEYELRSICTICGCVHYQNPKMVVGCLVEHENKILLCRRKIQPSYGLWTLPAGYMELGESAAEGAKRETLEEAEAEVEPVSLFAHIDIPLIGQCRAT
ncbi:hypothetical protein O6H91_07G052800 [Diphasiastrum complanatum]|uniref:Uncharacterized protein n=1 Tax=Diphasiastrum complanatum TaxID=34168 RepID=A0ACC2D584_DIPCM|nr:hypothetical protein O6H91_07G052800 [Diphasiastrum complanatum]